MSWATLLTRLKRFLGPHGMDLVNPLCTSSKRRAWRYIVRGVQDECGIVERQTLSALYGKGIANEGAPAITTFSRNAVRAAWGYSRVASSASPPVTIFSQSQTNSAQLHNERAAVPLHKWFLHLYTRSQRSSIDACGNGSKPEPKGLSF